MPTGKARGLTRKKRKREASLESDSLGKDERETKSCVPVTKKVIHSMYTIRCAFFRDVKYIDISLYSSAKPRVELGNGAKLTVFTKS